MPKRKEKQNAYFSISQIPNKGRGLLSRTQIPEKTVIITEQPLIKVQKNSNFSKVFYDKLNNLTYENQELFMKLHHEIKSQNRSELAMDIFQKNAIDFYDATALFLTISYINHSCDPNAYWYRDGEKMKVITLKHIDESTEITCSYFCHFDYYFSVDDRQNKLKKQWNFDCKCNSCERMIDDKTRKQNDLAMQILKELNFDVNEYLISQLFDETYDHNLWNDILNNARKQIMYIEKYFDSDILALWKVYHKMLIATIKIGKENEKKTMIEKYNHTFENVNLKWSEDRTMLFIIFIFADLINFSSPHIITWKAKMKNRFHFLFNDK